MIPSRGRSAIAGASVTRHYSRKPSADSDARTRARRLAQGESGRQTHRCAPRKLMRPVPFYYAA